MSARPCRSNTARRWSRPSSVICLGHACSSGPPQDAAAFDDHACPGAGRTRRAIRRRAARASASGKAWARLASASRRRRAEHARRPRSPKRRPSHAATGMGSAATARAMTRSATPPPASAPGRVSTTIGITESTITTITTTWMWLVDVRDRAAEEVPGPRHAHHPSDAADDVVGEEAAVVHLPDTRHDRRERADDRHEPRDHDRLRAVPLVELAGALDVLGVEQAWTSPPVKSAGPRRRPMA